MTTFSWRVIGALIVAASAGSQFSTIILFAPNSRQESHEKESPSSSGQFENITALMDPSHSPYLTKHSTALGVENFPTPQFHGCTDNGFCRFTNVCFSQHDGMMIFDVPDSKTNESSIEWNKFTSRRNQVTTPSRPWLVPYERYRTLKNVYFADKVLSMSCWRHGQTSVNPAHFLMGHGKLLVASSGFYTNASLHFDLLLYHHCMPPHWNWADRISHLLWEHAFSRGVVTGPRDLVSMYLPFVPFNRSARPPYGTPGVNTDDIVVCGREVYQEPFSSARYLGTNPPSVVDEWQTLIQTKFFPGRDKLVCARGLRIAVWKRTEGTALRLLVNMDDIKRVVGEYSDIPLSVVTLSSESSFEEQMALFNSFDILISSHGSHLANMLFSPPDVAFIEVASIFANDHFMVNGQAFAKKYILSLGHLPHNNTRLAGMMEQCNRHTNVVECPAWEYKQSDLIVNTTILRTDLREVIASLCEIPESTNRT